LVWWFRKFDWHATHRRWLLAAGFWAVFLVLDGLILFLPTVLAGAKFTHSIVAHAHLAMAGLLTSLNVLMLISLAPGTQVARTLAGRGSWLAWNLACLGMVIALTVLGFFEAENPLLVPYGGTIVRTIYVIRLVLGAVMFSAGLHWLISAARCRGTAKIKVARTAPSTTSTPVHAN
jgi:cytochrome c oxidase cbb3-type subunit 1